MHPSAVKRLRQVFVEKMNHHRLLIVSVVVVGLIGVGLKGNGSLGGGRVISAGAPLVTSSPLAIEIVMAGTIKPISVGLLGVVSGMSEIGIRFTTLL
jgi:hypothetical protein